MTGTIVFIILLYLIVILFLIYIAASIGSGNERQKELIAKGNPVTGSVFKLKYRRYYNLFFIKTGFSDIKVEFTWKGEYKKLAAASAVPNDIYKVGDSVELLYLEKYPKIVVVAGTKPLSSKQILGARIFCITLAVILAIFAVTGARDEMRREESRRRVKEFLDSRMASEEYSSKYEELMKTIDDAYSK